VHTFCDFTRGAVALVIKTLIGGGRRTPDPDARIAQRGCPRLLSPSSRRRIVENAMTRRSP